MKKVGIILGIIFGIFLILLIVFYFMIKSFLTEERITKFVEEKIETATLLKAEIKRVTPGISLKGVYLTAYDLKLYKNKKKVISSKKIEFNLKLIPLIFKKIEIGKVLIVEPEVVYRIKEKRRKAEKKKEKEIEKKTFERIPFTFFLENLEIKDGNFKIQNGEKIQITNFDLSLRGSLKGKILIVKGRSNFEIGVKGFNFPIKNNFSFNMNINKDLLEIKNVVINILGNNIKVKGKLENLLYGNLTYDIYLISEKFDVQKINQILKNKFLIKGILNIDLNIKGKENPLFYGRIKSESLNLKLEKESLSIRKFEVNLRGERVSFSFFNQIRGIKSDINGSVKIFPSINFKINSKSKGNLEDLTGIKKNFLLKLNVSGNPENANMKGTFSSDKNVLHINLDFNLNKKINVKGNVSSSYLNINEFVKKEKGKKGEKPASKKVPFLVPPGIKVDIEFFMKELIYKKEIFRNIRFRVQGEGTKIKIKNFRGEAYGGIIEGNVSLKKGSLLLSTNIKARNIRLERLISSYKFIPLKITGSVSINSRTFLDLENILQTLNSENTSVIVNGHLEGNKVLEKISGILKLKELEKLYFQRIDLKFEIKKGFIHFPKFDIKAKDMEIAPEGRVSLKGELDIKTDFLFKGAYINKLKKSGILPKIFSGIREIPLTFYIKGTHQNPQIRIDLSKLERKIKRGIKKEIKKKTFKEKEELKKKIQKELEKLKKQFGGFGG